MKSQRVKLELKKFLILMKHSKTLESFRRLKMLRIRVKMMMTKAFRVKMKIAI